MDNIVLENKRVLVTGASSMIGKACIETLKKRKADIIPIYHSEYDLLKEESVNKIFLENRPHYVIHLAGYNGNIVFNSQFGADIFQRTTAMGLNVLGACLKYNVKKCISALTSCAFSPSDESLKEEDFMTRNSASIC